MSCFTKHRFLIVYLMVGAGLVLSFVHELGCFVILAPASVILLKALGALEAKQRRIGDLVLYKPPMVELQSALRYAHEVMAVTGWDTSDYRKYWKDCEEFAERQSTLMKEWFYENVKAPIGAGLAIATFGYRKENGKGHVVVECINSKGRHVFFEVYPGYGEPINLTNKEIQSSDWFNFGK